MKKLVISGFILCAHMAFAGPLTVTEYQTVDKEKIPKAATLNGVPLLRVGSAIRQKRVVFLSFDVYRATLFASDGSFVRDLKDSVALDSLQNMKVRALQLKILRSLSAKDIVKSFDTALIENGVKDSPSLKEFKKAIENGGDVVEGDLVNISVDKEKGVLICEQGKNVVEIKGDANFFRDIFSIWLGKPADKGLRELREKLIKGV